MTSEQHPQHRGREMSTVGTTALRQQRRLPALTAALTVAAALAGCGSAAATHPASTGAAAAAKTGTVDTAFVHKVSTWCAQTIAHYHTAQGAFPVPGFDPLHPDPAVLPQVGRYLARGNQVRDGIPAGLRALGEPATLTAQWDRVRDRFLRTIPLARAQISAALAGNATAFAALAVETQDLGKQIDAAGTAAGFPASSACADLF
jgi:hypothetical protein